MKTLNLEQMGVHEMDAKEIKSVDGGSFWLGVLVGGLIYDIISDPGAVIDGYNAGRDAYNNSK